MVTPCIPHCLRIFLWENPRTLHSLVLFINFEQNQRNKPYTKTLPHITEMEIDNRNILKEWLDQNYWFEDGFISEINNSKTGLEIVVGYQTNGNYIAGEKKEIKEFTIKPNGLSKWTYKNDKFIPSREICIEGIDLIENGFGLKFETPNVFEMACNSIEISEPKITKTYTKPWVSNREIFITKTEKKVPKPNYWIEQFEKYDLNIGFRYFASELIQTEKIPYPDYSGYFIQTLENIKKTDKGLFIKIIEVKDNELSIVIENDDENDNLFQTIQLIVSNWENSVINSGNVKFIGKEFKDFLENGIYPEQIEKIINVW